MKISKSAAKAMIGPVLFAGSNLLVSVLLQQADSATNFGAYAFAQVVVAASLGISNGLFGIPIISAIGKGDATEVEAVRSLALANVVFCLFASITSMLLMLHVTGGSYGTSLLALVFTALSGARWFVRLHSLADLNSASAFRLDGIFSAIVVPGSLLLFKSGLLNTAWALGLMSLACAASLFGARKYARRYVCSFVGIGKLQDLSDLRKRGLAAVCISMCFEAIATGPAYYLSIAQSTAAYAPVAVALLFFRPYGVLLTAAMQYQRPRVARAIRDQGHGSVAKMLAKTVMSLGATWALNVIGIMIIVLVIPERIYRSGYEAATVNASLLLVGTSVLVKAFREPLASVLLVTDQFKRLGLAALIGAATSASILFYVHLRGTASHSSVLSSVLAGELAAFVFILRAYMPQLAGKTQL